MTETTNGKRRVLASKPETISGRSARRFAIGFGSLFVLVGLAVMVWGVTDLVRASVSEDWPYVTGTVLSSEVDVDTSGDGTTYGPEVHYSYEVDGVVLEGDRITFGSVDTGNHDRAQIVVDRYPIGAEVTVWFDPGEASRSVLEPGKTGGAWAEIGIGAVFVSFALIWIWLFVRISKRSKS